MEEYVITIATEDGYEQNEIRVSASDKMDALIAALCALREEERKFRCPRYD